MLVWVSEWVFWFGKNSTANDLDNGNGSHRGVIKFSAPYLAVRMLLPVYPIMI